MRITSFPMLAGSCLPRLITGAAFATVLSSQALAGSLFIAFDNFNYGGTVTRYNTLGDAQSASNAVGSYTIATATNGPRSTLENARDGNVWVASSSPGYYATDTSYFSTAWYFTTFPANGDGWGNPNNTNNGFVQYYDESAAPVVDGGWSNGYQTFTVDITGGNGDSFNYARLWAGLPGGPASDTAGSFLDFALHLEADFASAAQLNGVTGWYELGEAPTGVTGYASGLFQNNSANAALNGYYTFDFTFANGSWADQADATYGGAGPSAFFAAPEMTATDVPEPATLSLMGLALFGIAAMRRRRV